MSIVSRIQKRSKPLSIGFIYPNLNFLLYIPRVHFPIFLDSFEKKLARMVDVQLNGIDLVSIGQLMQNIIALLVFVQRWIDLGMLL